MSFIETIKEDIKCIKDRDPVVPSTIEALCCYPGLHAILLYRLANFLWRGGIFGIRMKFIARFISYLGRFISGVDLHPGATLGKRIFIDHATGLVIGETTEIEDDVTLYHGVTLGGISLANPPKGAKRHPTLKKGAIVGAGAQVLGPITIGEGALIGANSVVTKNIPKGATAAGNPSKIIKRTTKKKTDDESFPAYGIPSKGIQDPTAKELEKLKKDFKKLEQKIADMDKKNKK
ncbi:MAG: serine O-acetyltransferase [Alphaproteobacteria bacterium]|nr:serine O-acetyltransferase [Alphaproteobacteria bacterium]